MLRINIPFVAMLVGAIALLTAAAAEAGQARVHGGSHYSSFAGHQPSGRQMRGLARVRHYGQRHDGRRLAYRAGRSRHGIFIGRQLPRLDAGRRHGLSSLRYSRRQVPHRRAYSSTGALVITIGEAGAVDARDKSGVVLENGRCAAGEYCTLRLGPYANSPKIITLNTSGKTITDPGL